MKKRYVPRPVDPAGGLRILGKAVDAITVLPRHKSDEVQLLALTSLTALTSGQGTAEHIGAISLVCNMACALIRQGIGEEATEIVERCQTALLNADRRFSDKGVWGFSGPEIEHVRDLLNVHETMTANSTIKEIRLALADVNSRASAGFVMQRIAA